MLRSKDMSIPGWIEVYSFMDGLVVPKLHNIQNETDQIQAEEGRLGRGYLYPISENTIASPRMLSPLCNLQRRTLIVT